LLAAIAIWGFSGFFRVDPDELGVVLRFGKYVREVQPGLNYHLPYPIETALTPQALRVNKIDIGMRVAADLRRGTTIRRVPEESLMLTGDENIVDVDFSVLWKIKPNVSDYLFNIQQPEGTVKAVAESATREVVGRSNIQPILTGARQNIEIGVQDLMQSVLDKYGAGIQITQVQLQKVDPPSQVIDAFRDVQAARADLERSQNEAQTYANKVVPERADAPRRSPRTPKPIASRRWPRLRARRHASSRSTMNTRRRPMSPASACIWKPWNGCSEAPTRSSWIREVGSFPICRSTSSRGDRRRRRRRKAADETQSRGRHCRRTENRVP
jgi:HflK protein